MAYTVSPADDIVFAPVPSERGHVAGLRNPRPFVDQLPGALQEDEFCRNLVSAFDEVIAPVFSTLDCFEAYLDPVLAPPDFVEWLATWVGVDIDETWTLERRRRLIKEAATLYRIRGTVAGLAAHLRLYAGVAPEIEESGGCGWSQTADNPIPGSAQPYVVVRLPAEDVGELRQSTIGRIVAENRPAHVPYQVEIVSRSGTVQVDAPEEPATEAAADAPGAIDLPGSEHIELAVQAPPTQAEVEDVTGDAAEGTDAGA
ncbi:MAG TPA: phage tail protein [Acidimicrobiales bacterium]|nr:phage tail protein [Acidimicrobiales bacterium]